MSTEIARKEALGKAMDEETFKTLLEMICSSKGITLEQLTPEFQSYWTERREIFGGDEEFAKLFFWISEAAKVPQIRKFIDSDPYGTPTCKVWKSGIDCAERRGISYDELAERVKEYATHRAPDMYPGGAWIWFFIADELNVDPDWYQKEETRRQFSWARCQD